MRMLELDPYVRDWFQSIMKLSTDGHGNEVFVGLTREETDWLLDQEMFNQSRAERMDKIRGTRFLELSHKHETARLLALGLANAQKLKGNT